MKMITQTLLSTLVAITLVSKAFGMQYDSIDPIWGTYVTNGHTPLHTAACNGNLERVKELLAHVPEEKKLEFIMARDGTNDSIAYDSLGYTALHFAAIRGHIEIVKMLIEALPKAERQVLLTNKDTSNCTAFDLAARYGNINVVIELWKHYTKEEQLKIPALSLLRLGLTIDSTGKLKEIVQE